MHSEDVPVNEEYGKYLVQGLINIYGNLIDGLVTLLKKNPFRVFDSEKEITLHGKIWFETADYIKASIAITHVDKFMKRIRYNGYDGGVIHAYTLEGETRDYIESFMTPAPSELKNLSPYKNSVRECREPLHFGIIFREVGAESRKADEESVYLNGYLVDIFVKRVQVPQVPPLSLQKFIKSTGIEIFPVTSDDSNPYLFSFYTKNNEFRKLVEHL